MWRAHAHSHTCRHTHKHALTRMRTHKITRSHSVTHSKTCTQTAQSQFIRMILLCTWFLHYHNHLLNWIKVFFQVSSTFPPVEGTKVLAMYTIYLRYQMVSYSLNFYIYFFITHFKFTHAWTKLMAILILKHQSACLRKYSVSWSISSTHKIFSETCELCIMSCNIFRSLSLKQNEAQSTCALGGILFWGCTSGWVYVPWILHACWMRVTGGNSGLCCCICVT